MTVVACVGAFLLSAAVSTWGSNHPLQSLIRGAWTPWILAACLGYALWADRLAPVVRPALTGLLLVLCAGSLWQVWTGEHLESGRLWRAHGFLPHPNDTALAAILTPLVSPWCWPVAAGIVLLSGSRTALVGLAVALVMLLRGWRAHLTVVLVAAAALLLLVHASALTSFTSRFGAWAVAWRMFREHPWIGTGPQTFVDHYLIYLPKTLPFGVEPNIAFVPWAHSLYLEILAERGLLGFAGMALVLFFAWRSAPRVLRASMAAILVMGVVDLTLLKPWVVAAVFGVVTLALTGYQPARHRVRYFRAHSWPPGWLWRDQDGQHRNGVGVRVGAWTYFVAWGPGPYLT